MAKPAKNTAVIVARRRDSVALPPCTLGFASLTEPDTYDPDKPLFKADACFNPAGIAALAILVQKECIDANLEKLREEMASTKGMEAFVGVEPQSPEAWLAGKLKQPKENARVPLPKLVVSRKATYQDRSGNTVTRDIGCWDAHNNPLNLKALKLGMGSTVQIVVNPNLYISKLIGFPQPKFDLVGIRVLRLKQFGGQRPPTETDEDAIREVLGEEFVVDEDLSAFAAGSTLPGAQPGGDAPPPASDEDTVRGAF
jgi:hypothetical protein